MINIGIISGSFDLLHFGHIEYLNEASKRFDIVIPIINTAEWVAHHKKRETYLSGDLIKEGMLKSYPNFRFIPGFNFHGGLNPSVAFTLKALVHYLEDKKFDKKDITFFKMKDRGTGNCPEEKLCLQLGINFEHAPGLVAQHTSKLYKGFANRVFTEELKKWQKYKEEESSSL